MEEKKREESLSILMFPWLAHGHVFPYLELAKLLSKHNFTIFFCSTPVILESLHGRTSSLPITLVELHLPSPPDLPPDLHSTKHAPPHLMPLLRRAVLASRPAFSALLASLNPSLLIYDALQPWAANAAAALGIPAVHFATTGAAAYSFFLHMSTKRDVPFPHDALFLRRREWAALQNVDTSSFKEDDDPIEEIGFPHFSRSRDVVLMKTSRAVEGKYIDYLSLLSNKKIISVGPLITPPTTTPDAAAGGGGVDEDSDIMNWLAEKDKLSTIFISFGSENYLSKNQIQEMAKALEASTANFIWVLRTPQGEREEAEEGGVPVGFLERVRERGKVVEGWAPQARILAHENVCGFISHCGMSSTIESVYYGVPVIGVPVKLDQPLNARLLVEAGVGVEMERDELSGDFRGDEVAAAIERVVEDGEGMRARTAEMGAAMRAEEEFAAAEAAEHLRRICVMNS